MDTMHPIVIGLDLGTTNSKAVALSASGEVLAMTSSSYVMHSPHSGWAEQHAPDVWDGACESLRLLAGKLQGQRLIGLCLSGAMHSVLPVDAGGAPLAPAMTWADQRAASQSQELRQHADVHTLYQRTGCPLQPIYHPAKLRWWLEAAPDSSRRTTHFVAIKDWVLYKLTGCWATDFGLASTTGLLDIHRFIWDEEALRLVGVQASRLPPLVSPFEIVDAITEEAAARTGLPAGLPVVAGSHDGGLANLGAGASTSGESVITVGTSGAVRCIVDLPLLDPQERTWCYVLAEDRWLAGGAINNGGLTLQWVRDTFYADIPGDKGYAQLLSDAAEISPGAQGLILLPYLTGERSPHWDPSASAMMVGLALEHTRGHIARAALEGVAFCLADVWGALSHRQEVNTNHPIRLTGGITRSPLWSQILSDVLGVQLITVEAADASTIGAAMLGHQALGMVSVEALAASVKPGSIFLPDPGRHSQYSKIHHRFQKLYRDFRY